ncbi:50S ribosomal protein L24 [Candidatus Woesearchaeota archaeon]|nr:50S ribosomal protein L24 [Candidatus Woesearchaeota archaeon]
MTERTKFTTTWKKSSQARKQRKYVHRAPLHIKQKLMHAHLAPALREKYNGLRRIQLRKGDKVKVLRGEFKTKDGKVEHVRLKKNRAYVIGLDRLKADGSKVPVPIHPSNLMIMELDLGDRKRKAKLAAEKPAEKNQKITKSNKTISPKTVSNNTAKSSKEGTVQNTPSLRVNQNQQSDMRGHNE